VLYIRILYTYDSIETLVQLTGSKRIEKLTQQAPDSPILRRLIGSGSHADLTCLPTPQLIYFRKNCAPRPHRCWRLACQSKKAERIFSEPQALNQAEIAGDLRLDWLPRTLLRSDPLACRCRQVFGLVQWSDEEPVVGVEIRIKCSEYFSPRLFRGEEPADIAEAMYAPKGGDLRVEEVVVAIGPGAALNDEDHGSRSKYLYRNR
jgi:hypothetical protein